MVKVGDTVKWDAGSKGMLGGKVTGGEKGKRWKIEKAGKTYYVVKDKVKKGIVKKSEKKPAAKKPSAKTTYYVGNYSGVYNPKKMKADGWSVSHDKDDGWVVYKKMMGEGEDKGGHYADARYRSRGVTLTYENRNKYEISSNPTVSIQRSQVVKSSDAKKPAPAPAKKPAPKKPAPAPAKKPAAKKPAPKKPAAKKPVVDKNLLQNVMGVMATVGKEKGGKKDDEKQEEILLKYSIPQLKKAYNSALDEKKPGFTQPFRRGTTKIHIIGKAKKEKFNLLKFLTDKPKKDPTKKYILEGFNLIDDDRDDDESGMDYELEDAGFKFKQSYATGLIALEANLSVDQLKDFVKNNGEIYEDYTRLYTETKRYKRMVWDGLSS